MIITGIANKIPDKIKRLVYLDAAFPKIGQSLFDILIEAYYDPEIVLEGAPKAYRKDTI
jgi:hypothetical protein